MRFLLDTHIALWAVYKPDALPKKAQRAMLREGAELYVSAASLWEIALKNTKKPGLLPPVAEARDDFAQAGFHELPVHGHVMQQLESLPMIHADPFDRLLVATAFVEPMHLLTHDIQLRAYDEAGKIIVVC
jgi:PIN domain nuclease of toxin-antitoxin system